MPTTNYPREIHRYTKTDHFKEKLEERPVTEEMVEQCLEHGKPTWTTEKGDAKFVLEEGGIEVIVVVVGNSEDQNAILVTTWLNATDRKKAEEYWGVEMSVKASVYE